MTELLAEEDKDFEKTEEALSEAYWKSSANAVIVLMELTTKEKE